MSLDKMQVIRTAFEGLNKGDWDTALKDFAPDFVFDNSQDLGEWRGVHTGADQAKDVWQRLTEAWETIRYEIVELIPADDHVLSHQTASFRGRGGIEVETRTNWVWTFREGKVIRVETFGERADALEAAGLRE
jgi:ketosteroid isomerase-like protein